MRTEAEELIENAADEIVATEEELTAAPDGNDAYSDALKKQSELQGKEVVNKPEGEDWYLKEGVKGEGPKPDWYLDKFKTVEDQAIAYKELEKKFGGFKGAPKEYNYDLPDHGEVKFTKEDPLMQNFEKLARDTNMSQEAFTQCLDIYVSTIKASQPNVQDELKKLGPTAKAELENLNNWLNNNLSSTELETVKSMTMTAEQIKILAKFRKMTQENKLGAQQAKINKAMTEKQLQQMVADPKYNTDPGYRAEVEKKFAEYYG